MVFSKCDFLIAAPAYSSRSGGIMVLHELCTALNRLGYRAGMLLIVEGSQNAQGFKFAYSNEMSFYDPVGEYFDFSSGKSEQEIVTYIRNSCVIYPDIVKGNPLGARNYVTYVLGRPQFKIESEFVLSFSKLYIENPDHVLFKPFISEWMNARETYPWWQRKLDITYIGKGQEYLECHIIPGSLLVERDWPKDKRQLAGLLRNCRYFFSWDTVSAINCDAVLCGAVPVLMHDLQIPRNLLDCFEHGPFPPISYSTGLESGETLSNILSINQAISNMQNSLHDQLASWPFRVSEFAEKIQLMRK